MTIHRLDTVPQRILFPNCLLRRARKQEQWNEVGRPFCGLKPGQRDSSDFFPREQRNNGSFRDPKVSNLCNGKVHVISDIHSSNYLFPRHSWNFKTCSRGQKMKSGVWIYFLTLLSTLTLRPLHFFDTRNTRDGERERENQVLLRTSEIETPIRRDSGKGTGSSVRG